MNRPDYAADIAQMAADMLVLNPGAAARFEAELRQRYGGEVLRIAPVAPVTPEGVDADLRARKPVSAIAAEYGVHRSTIYRLLRRKKSRAADVCDTGTR
mgnify:CR=1 FL=1